MVLRKLLRGAGFMGLTFGAGTLVYVGVTRAHGQAAKRMARERWSRAWARGLLQMFGVETLVSGADPTDGENLGRIIVANHRSIIDIAILLSIFGGAFVARGDIEGWPIVGPAARAAGTIFVDRASKASGRDAIQAMVERLDHQDTVCVFPEGTTFVDDPVRPFKPGACVAAARAHVPVVPVGLVYPKGSGAAFGGETFLRHLGRLAETRKTRVRVEIGEPLHRQPDEKLEAYSERCRSEVERLMQRGRAADG